MTNYFIVLSHLSNLFSNGRKGRTRLEETTTTGAHKKGVHIAAMASPDLSPEAIKQKTTEAWGIQFPPETASDEADTTARVRPHTPPPTPEPTSGFRLRFQMHMAEVEASHFIAFMRILSEQW